MNQYSDDDISHLLSSGDSKAIKILHGTHYSMMYSVAIRILNNHADAQDAVQEVFVKLWNNRQNIKVISSFGGYLRRAANNQSISLIREKGKFNFVEETIESEAHQPLESKELENAINEAIDQLPEKCRLVFLLSRDEGFKNKEIAEQLDVSIKAVEKQITKALKHLKNQLKPFLTDHIETDKKINIKVG